MKTTVFRLVDPVFELIDKNHGLVKEIYTAATLPAYAILNSNLERHCDTIDLMYVPERHQILGNKIIINGVHPALPGEIRSSTLTINYSGIRDYRKLFPHIENSALNNRLGEFAEEADKAFDVGAWMSFTVLVASVLEGLLLNIYKEGTLFQLIRKAKKELIINDEEEKLLNDARDVRNRIHAGAFESPLAGREVGNDLYVLYDRMIKKNWK